MTAFVLSLYAGIQSPGFFFVNVLDLLRFMLYLVFTVMLPFLLEFIMNLNARDKEILSSALETEIARIRRAINSEKSMAIREIHYATLADVQAIAGRVSNEVVK